MKYLNVLRWMLPVLLFSCADWLDVNPKTDMKSEVLYTTENGFKSALTGIYGRMSKGSAYGGTLTFNFMEQLAQRYDQKEVSETERAKIYDYKSNASSKSNVNTTWSFMYQTLANINNLLKFLDVNAQYITTPGYREIMKGEALGLRALHYFDLLSMWGPCRFAENKSVKVLPYRDQFLPDKVALMSADSIAIRIIADLKEAEILLENDPMELLHNPEEPFMANRRLRMNKYAVKALMARVFLWIGDKENAALKAQEVIDGCGMKLGRDNRNDAAFYEETLFGLHMYNMYQNLSGYFFAEYSENAGLWITKDNVDAVFEANSIGMNDIRYKGSYGFIFYTTPSREVKAMCRKYLEVASSVYKENIPLIRLSEMYYILAECLSYEEGAQMLNMVRKARGISQQYSVSFSTEEQRAEELEKEYQKDFFCEGQFFYFLKRYERKDFYRCPKAGSMKTEDYVFPVPDGEVEYGWVEY